VERWEQGVISPPSASLANHRWPLATPSSLATRHSSLPFCYFVRRGSPGRLLTPPFGVSFGEGLLDVSRPPPLGCFVRRGSPDPAVLCDRWSPCPRPLACHLEASGRPNGDCSSTTTSVDRRGPTSMPRAEPVTALPARQGVTMLRHATFSGFGRSLAS